MSGTSLDAPVGGSALSAREVSFAPMHAGKGSSLGLPERLSGTLSSWFPSKCSSKLGHNIPAEAKSLKYNGSSEWRLFFAKFKTLARHNGLNDDDCLLALSVSVEKPAPRYVHILSSSVEGMTFGNIASRFEQRFGKGTLQAASQVLFSSTTPTRTVGRPSY